MECWHYDRAARKWTNEGELGGGAGGGTIAALDPTGVDESTTDEFWLIR